METWDTSLADRIVSVFYFAFSTYTIISFFSDPLDLDVYLSSFGTYAHCHHPHMQLCTAWRRLSVMYRSVKLSGYTDFGHGPSCLVLFFDRAGRHYR